MYQENKLILFNFFDIITTKSSEYDVYTFNDRWFRILRSTNIEVKYFSDILDNLYKSGQLEKKHYNAMLTNNPKALQLYINEVLNYMSFYPTFQAVLSFKRSYRAAISKCSINTKVLNYILNISKHIPIGIFENMLSIDYSLVTNNLDIVNLAYNFISFIDKKDYTAPESLSSITRDIHTKNVYFITSNATTAQSCEDLGLSHLYLIPEVCEDTSRLFEELVTSTNQFIKEKV